MQFYELRDFIFLTLRKLRKLRELRNACSLRNGGEFLLTAVFYILNIAETEGIVFKTIEIAQSPQLTRLACVVTFIKALFLHVLKANRNSILSKCIIYKIHVYKNWHDNVFSRYHDTLHLNVKYQNV